MFTQNDIENIITLYNEGKGITFIANKYNTYFDKIKKILQEHNVTLRTRKEQNKITNQARGMKVNHNYFDTIDSLQKPWILGFLAADGTVRKEKNEMKLGLCSVDKEILIKMKKEMEIEREVKDSITNKGFNVSTLTWSSENQKCKLAKYDIVPNKTYKGMHLNSFNNNIDYQLAFFLGYYDGDGCFKNDGTTCRIEICSYSSDILSDFVECINNKFGVFIKVYKDPSKQNYYTITYSTQMAVIILDYIYNLMIKNNCFFLQRKYNKYMEWKKQNNRI